MTGSLSFNREYAALGKRVRSILLGKVPEELHDQISTLLEGYIERLAHGYELLVQSDGEIDVYIVPYVEMVKELLETADYVKRRIDDNAAGTGMASRRMDRLQDVYQRYVIANPEYEAHKAVWLTNVQVYARIREDQNKLLKDLNLAAGSIGLDRAQEDPELFIKSHALIRILLDQTVIRCEHHAKRCMQKGGPYMVMTSEVSNHYKGLLAERKV